MAVCDGPCSGCCGDFFLWLTRFLGLATTLATWGIGVETSFYGHYLGFYILAVSILVTFLEGVFAIHYCVVLFTNDESCCRRGWDIVLWLDDWRKGILYVGLSVPCFVQPNEVWLGVVAGIMLVLCSIFYMFKTFKTNVDRERIKLAQNPSYDKFDDLQDDIEDEDDNVITHHGTITIMDEATLGDQQDILEV